MKRNAKVMTAIIITTILVLAMATTVFAAPAMRGHRSQRYGRIPAEETDNTRQRLPICPVEGCTKTGPHAHDGKDYCGGCTDHDGKHHSLCPVEGCTETGLHSHDGKNYCGGRAAWGDNWEGGRGGGCWGGGRRSDSRGARHHAYGRGRHGGGGHHGGGRHSARRHHG